MNTASPLPLSCLHHLGRVGTGATAKNCLSKLIKIDFLKVKVWNRCVKKMKTQCRGDLSPLVLMAALLTTAKAWKQPVSVIGWMDRESLV